MESPGKLGPPRKIGSLRGRDGASMEGLGDGLAVDLPEAPSNGACGGDRKTLVEGHRPARRR